MLVGETERLIIREAQEEDIEEVIGLESHEDNRPYLFLDDYEGHRHYIEDDNFILMVMEKKEDGRIIGYSLVELDRPSQVFNLRRIAISEKSRGYGKEAMLAIFRHCFEDLAYNRLWLDVYPFHQVGVNLYEGLGMHLDGVLRENYRDERGYLDQMVYSLLRDEYFEIYK